MHLDDREAESDRSVIIPPSLMGLHSGFRGLSGTLQMSGFMGTRSLRALLLANSSDKENDKTFELPHYRVECFISMSFRYKIEW